MALSMLDGVPSARRAHRLDLERPGGPGGLFPALCWAAKPLPPLRDRGAVPSGVLALIGGAISSVAPTQRSPVESRHLVAGTFLNLSLAIFNQEGVQVLASTTSPDPNCYGRPQPVGTFIVKESASFLFKTEHWVPLDLHDDPPARADHFGAWPGVLRSHLDWLARLAHDRSARTTTEAVHG